MVILTVTDHVLDKFEKAEQFVGPTKTAVIKELLRHGTQNYRVGDMTPVTALLQMHDDIRIGGPTWDTRFQFNFRED